MSTLEPDAPADPDAIASGIVPDLVSADDAEPEDAEETAERSAAALPEPAAAPGPPRGPLGTLALSFSGGGYRAAGFNLGVLRLLDRVGLLPSVAALSTVSGGTILGAAWVASLLEKRPFDEFYQQFSAFLRGTNVIRDALDHLTGTRGRDGASTPSLIRSAASVYARPDFLGDRSFGDVLDSPDLPLDEVIFNSTEFHTGVDFRFRRSANPNAVIGNGNLRVPREVAANTRLADVVAASSCFPSAFEPFLFPDQFAWPRTYPLDTARAALGQPFRGGLPLMDGGVYDNQGVDALVLAYDRAPAQPVLLISDTSPPRDQLYEFPKSSRRGWMTLTMVNVIAWILLLLAVGSVVGLLVSAWRNPPLHTGRWLLLYGLPLATSALVAAALVWVRLQVAAVRKILRGDLLIENAWKDLRALTVAEMVTLVRLRVSSLAALTGDIFMKRVRGLIYSSVFADPRYEGRRIGNLIYSMTLGRPTLFARQPWLRPGDRLRALADRASAVPTALWLESDDQLALLVEAGEATTCFSLLKFILELPPQRQADRDVAELFQRLRQEWTAMNT